MSEFDKYLQKLLQMKSCGRQAGTFDQRILRNTRLQKHVKFHGLTMGGEGEYQTKPRKPRRRSAPIRSVFTFGQPESIKKRHKPAEYWSRSH